MYIPLVLARSWSSLKEVLHSCWPSQPQGQAAKTFYDNYKKNKKVITELLQQIATLDTRFLTKICIKWSQKGAAIPMTVAGNLTVYSSPNYNSSLCYLTWHCHVIWTSSPFQVTCQNYPLTGSLQWSLHYFFIWPPMDEIHDFCLWLVPGLVFTGFLRGWNEFVCCGCI